MNKNNKNAIVSILTAFILCAFIFTIFFLNNKGEFGVKEITYNEFVSMAKDSKVKEVMIDFTDSEFTFIDVEDKYYTTSNPNYDEFKLDMLKMGIKVTEKDSFNIYSIFGTLINFLFIGIMIYYISMIFRQQNGNVNNKLIKPEKDEKHEETVTNGGKKVVNKRRTSFKDVAGLKQVKNDMMLLVDFLKNPQKYKDAGAKLPKGVILYGPPGTGKTLLAKALAGEAGVPFFNMSGSDFIEMYVGMGAKRVRELFSEARKNAPCIIFIDELDAIGNSRNNLSNGNTEHRQTINALLAEMDGFNGAEGILVIGATNRLEDLDSALVRPGRFDKHISVPLPETPEERLEVIQIYAKNKKFAEDVDFEMLAKETIGFSPAEIESVMNEATLISVQNNKRFVDRKCIDDAIFKMIMKGHAKDDSKRNIDEIKLVAWHEAGHAVIGKLCDMDISKVTIIPSTSGAGGVNIITPKKMGLYSIEEMENQVKMSYGGRCAEYLLFGDYSKVTTGASSDIRQATKTIKQMITTYGMTKEFGMVNLDELGIDADDLLLKKATELSMKLEQESLQMLKEHQDMHKEIVDILLEKETISGKELDSIYRKHMNLPIQVELDTLKEDSEIETLKNENVEDLTTTSNNIE